MNGDWRELFSRLFDEEEPEAPEAEALAEALSDEANREEARDCLRFDADLRDHLAEDAEGRMEVSREKLLAKALLREKSLDARSGSGRRMLLFRALPAAAAILLVVLAGWLWDRGQSRYPAPRIEGPFLVSRDGAPVAGTPELRRGDRIRVGSGQADLSLGGYCRVELDPGTELVLTGQPEQEVIELVEGRAVSQVVPGKGPFRVETVRGSVEVKGTEFITSVEYPQVQRGGSVMNRSAKNAIVKVIVVSGAVAYFFGADIGVLEIGMSKVFAAEEEAVAGLPEGMRGFVGMLQGKITERTDAGFSLQVEKVIKMWKSSKASNPESAIGRTLKFYIEGKHMRERVHTVAVGDSVVAGGAHKEGDQLRAVEVLVKAEEFPALQAKWEEHARRRKEAEERRRKEREEAERRAEQVQGNPEDLPEGARGFLGLLQGKLVKKTDAGFILQVEKVVKTWKGNKAENLDSLIGKELPFTAKRPHMRERVAARKAGDAIVVGGAHRGGGRLEAVEVLITAEELPALQERWAENERKRREKEERRREEQKRKEEKREF